MPNKRIINAMLKFNKCIAYYQLHGKYPQHRHQTDEISKLGRWIHDMRQAKQGNSNRSWYPELDTLAHEAGHPDMFHTHDRLTQATFKCKQCIAYRDIYDKFPSAGDSDKKIALMGKWMAKMKQAKLGRGKYVWYPELDQLAIKAGYPNMFTLKYTKK